MGTSPGRAKPKTMKLAFAASLLRTQHQGVRANTSWLGVGIACPSGATCLTEDCCFGELAQDPIQCVGPVQSGYHHHLIDCDLLSP